MIFFRVLSLFKPVYDNGTLVSYEITGGGYGHGIGMS